MSWAFQPLLPAAQQLANASPTVSLSSPADTGSTSDTTPDLVFTGTDAESNDIRYNVQIARNNAFTATSVIDSFSDPAEDFLFTLNTTTAYGQAFTGDGSIIGSATFKLRKIGSPTGNLYYHIYASTGTYGTDAIPTGSPLATSAALDVSTVTTSSLPYELAFSGANQITLTNGTRYILVAEYTNGDGSNNISLLADLDGHGGNYSGYTGGSWSASDFYDFHFTVTTTSFLTDVVSGTDPGFSGSPDNTDPFTSGQAVTYTVQSALDATTYYWRVRGIDPSGSNTYGAWSATRSFTVAPVSAALTGTITSSTTEADIVSGGKTIILTLTNDTWVTSGATFDAQRQNIINGIDSAQSEGTGWDAVVKAGLAVTDVARTSNTVVTITLPAFATYNITAQETITATIPSTAVTGAAQIVASPTFTVSTTGGAVDNQRLMLMGVG